MPGHNNDTKFENAIFVENLHLFLSKEERNGVVNALSQQQIEIVFHENENTVNASLFTAVTILFNEPLTKMIIADLLTMAAYDAIKYTISCFLANLKKIKLVKLSSKKEKVNEIPAQLNLRLKTSNAEMNVLLPNNLTHDQNLDYVDRMLKTMVELGKTEILRTQNYEMYIIEGNDDENPELLKVKTCIEYMKEQRILKEKN